MTLEPIVHVLSLRCDPVAAFDADARIGRRWHPDEFHEWGLLLRRFAALTDH